MDRLGFGSSSPHRACPTTLGPFPLELWLLIFESCCLEQGENKEKGSVKYNFHVSQNGFLKRHDLKPATVPALLYVNWTFRSHMIPIFIQMNMWAFTGAREFLNFHHSLDIHVQPALPRMRKVRLRVDRLSSAAMQNTVAVLACLDRRVAGRRPIFDEFKVNFTMGRLRPALQVHLEDQVASEELHNVLEALERLFVKRAQVVGLNDQERQKRVQDRMMNPAFVPEASLGH